MASAPYIPAQSGRLRLKDAARPGPIGARVYGALANSVGLNVASNREYCLFQIVHFNHCDFRIQLNGTFLNPLNYL